MAQLLTHPARAANLFLASLLLALPACTAGPWEREFWHPPAATGVAAIENGPIYPIERAAGTQSQWPNLADVPARQPVPVDQAVVTQDMQELQKDRAAAQGADAIVRQSAPAASVGATTPAAGAIVIPQTSPETPPEIE